MAEQPKELVKRSNQKFNPRSSSIASKALRQVGKGALATLNIAVKPQVLLAESLLSSKPTGIDKYGYMDTIDDHYWKEFDDGVYEYYKTHGYLPQDREIDSTTAEYVQRKIYEASIRESIVHQFGSTFGGTTPGITEAQSAEMVRRLRERDEKRGATYGDKDDWRAVNLRTDENE